MANVTYLLIEGKTETKDDIETFIRRVRSALENEFAPRDITISIQEPLNELDRMGVPINLDPKQGYS